jgi:hypothetical protein
MTSEAARNGQIENEETTMAEHDEPEEFDFDDEQEAHAEEIKNIVLDYVEENEVPEETAIFTLVQLAVSMHMATYMGSVEKPSVTGLKMELDRFGKEIDDMLREAKNGATEFVEDYKAAMEEEGDSEG